MTIIQAINTLDEIRPNNCPQPMKISWLSMLDGRIKSQIIDTHKGGELITFDGYDEKTSLETELLADPAYSLMYVKFLESQINAMEGDISRYASSAESFNSLFSSFEAHYNRTHLPIGRKIKYF